MLETITILLVLLWLLGMITSYTMAGYIHLLRALRAWGGNPGLQAVDLAGRAEGIILGRPAGVSRGSARRRSTTRSTSAGRHSLR